MEVFGFLRRPSCVSKKKTTLSIGTLQTLSSAFFKRVLERRGELCILSRALSGPSSSFSTHCLSSNQHSNQRASVFATEGKRKAVFFSIASFQFPFRSKNARRHSSRSVEELFALRDGLEDRSSCVFGTGAGVAPVERRRAKRFRRFFFFVFFLLFFVVVDGCCCRFDLDRDLPPAAAGLGQLPPPELLRVVLRVSREEEER